MKTHPLFAGSLLTAALFFSSLPALADATGVWKWTSQGRNGQSREVTLKLKQEGEKLTGGIQGQNGETPISEGKVSGEALSFKVTRETQRGTMTSTYNGKLEGDQIKGKISVKNGDNTNEREWNAKREGGSVDVAGEWAWVMKRDDGDPWQATLTIKKDGDKITGSFQREGADRKIEMQNAKLAGSTLTFETVMERDGQSVTIKSSAVVSGKSMKGKSEGNRDGEKWTREWEASRK